VFQGCGGTLWGGSVDFKQKVRFEVGNGSRVLFWQDVWCGELPLKTLFPALFNIACAKEA
jgi:hypothetical protein